MELKVWVEGIQRVICGITEQTTVQEVVIALAQATGRTGRYTLVEKWRDNEELLPPTEYPIKVLQKWGEHASDVQFLLKRTGASTSSSDIETSKGPERNIYRQSLPPLAKNREKNELLQALKRKEPKRKSLTITGGGTAQRHADDGKEKRSQNSNGNNNRVADEVSARYDRTSSGSVPVSVRKAAERFNANVSNGHSGGSSSKGGTGKGNDKSKHKSDKKSKEEPRPPKTALIPPHMQNQKGSVSSAAAALFPSESKSEVAAKSPIGKNADSQIKNLNIKRGKTALMPPTHKVLKSRNSSSTDQRQPSQSSGNPTSSNHPQNSSSGSLTPTPFSLPNENKLVNYAYRYGNSLPRSKKKSWSEANSASVDEKRLPTNPRETTKKTALMPPNHRQRSMTPNPQIHREAFRTLSTDGYSPVLSVPASRKSSSEQMKALDDFTKLVREQQRHIEEQRETVAALDGQIKSILDKMQKRDQDLDGSIAQLEEHNRLLDSQYEREYSVTDKLSAEDSKVSVTQQEMGRLQSEIDKSSVGLSAYKRKIDDLSKAISEEAQLQRAKQQRQAETNRNSAMRSRKDIEQVNWSLSSLEEEIKRIEKEIAIREEDISEKDSCLDALNRELRQVNLQQFIRKTGSKVTVLPPETGSLESNESRSPGNVHDYNPSMNISGSRSPLSPPAQGGNAEGVWV